MGRTLAAVTLRGIEKSFGQNRILKGVDLEIQSGEFLVMVGPSGCGKTTLLRCIAGLEQLDAGEISMDGQRVNGVSPKDRDVAMVFQSYALYPHMTVRENLAFGLTLRRLPAAEVDKRVKEASEMLELTPLLDRRPKALSGGQRQRVAMGRAIVRRPKVFLFDEPLSNLDTALRVQMRGELQKLHQRLGATMVYVTHDQVEAMTLASRVAVFNHGELQQVGAPLALYNQPHNRFVAGFLGSPGMNFLPTRIEGGLLKGNGFNLPVPGDLSLKGGEVLVGLRPQDLRVAGPGALLHGRVEAVEQLGFDGYAYLSTEAGPLVSRFEPNQRLEVGHRVPVSVVGDCLHVFTADGAQSLRHPRAVRPLELAS
jgi:multiple sugar transport system ATP-binding protein